MQLTCSTAVIMPLFFNTVLEHTEAFILSVIVPCELLQSQPSRIAVNAVHGNYELIRKALCGQNSTLYINSDCTL
jgi:hypothetical protein